MEDIPLSKSNEKWVFGYGSLMWQPNFWWNDRARATVLGFKRELCIKSMFYRGNFEQPGLVWGLDEGDRCDGLAFRIPPEVWQATVRYLRVREMFFDAYREAEVDLLLANGQRQRALTFVANPKGPGYLGNATEHERLTMVQLGFGEAGSCRDYILSTADAISKLGIKDPVVDRIVDALSRS